MPRAASFAAMAEDKRSPSAADLGRAEDAATARRRRQAEALRANLRRRKDGARTDTAARDGKTDAPGGPAR